MDLKWTQIKNTAAIDKLRVSSDTKQAMNPVSTKPKPMRMMECKICLF